MIPHRSRWFPSFALLATFAVLPLAGCRSASDLLYEPAATDPLDGYKGSLSEAGINTEMDWGPKQTLLLSEFKTLKEAHTQLLRRTDQLVAENQNLRTQLGNEGTTLQKEKALRSQAEAETETLRQRRRELEARILSLSIEKAKLEQVNLQAKIETLRNTLEQAPQSASTDAPAAPPRSR